MPEQTIITLKSSNAMFGNLSDKEYQTSTTLLTAEEAKTSFGITGGARAKLSYKLLRPTKLGESIVIEAKWPSGYAITKIIPASEAQPAPEPVQAGE
jgi:hypothetical protein